MDSENSKLRSELIKMLDALHNKVDSIDKRLSELEQQNHTTGASSLSDSRTINKYTTLRTDESADAKSTTKQSLQIRTTKVDTQVNTKSETPISPATTNTSASPVIKTPSKAGIVIKELLVVVLGPFASAFQQVVTVYSRYQKQGRGPAFLMTTAGILALVMGFGFLLQYSFNNYLGITGKIATGFISAIAMVLLGIRISNRNTLMSEFAAALIGLGIILNYLCAYFISGYFSIIGPTLGLALLAAITFAAYWLAIHYDTKTVAILSLLGGASTPLFLGDLSQIYNTYFIYLTLLAASMLHLSYKIKWPNLIQFTLIICISMIQYLFIEQNGNQLINNFLFTFLLHVLFYLFSFACLYQISKSDTDINKSVLLSLIGNCLFFIFVLYQSISIENYLGFIYLADALVLLLFYRFNGLTNYAQAKTKNDIKALLLLQIGLLSGFAILYLVSPSLLGLLWGIEGLLLVYIGFRFKMPSIRIEGYIAFFIGILNAATIAVLWFEKANFTNYGTEKSLGLHYNTGWMNLFVFGFVLWLATRLLQYYRSTTLKYEKLIFLWLQETLSIWITLAFMVSLFAVLSQEFLLFSIVPLFVLLYRAQKYQLAISEILGLAHYFFFVFQIFISAEQVNSFSLSQQNWIGIAVRIEAFLCLWLIAEFYSRFYTKSKFVAFARTLRILFYVLMPLLIIPKVIKSYDPFLPLVLWFSAAIALFLFTRLKYKALKIEFYILTVLAWVMTLIAVLMDYTNTWIVYANYALMTGLVFFIITSFIWKAFSPTYQRPESGDSERYQSIKDYVHLHHWFVYYLATTLFILSYGFTQNLSLSISLCSIYFTSLWLLWPKVLPAKTSLLLSYSLVFILSFASLILLYLVQLMASYDPLLPVYLIGHAGLLGLLLHKNNNAAVTSRHYFGGYLSQLWLFNIFVILVYSASINYWIPEHLRLLLSILLVLHAAILLMLTLRETYSGLLKLSVILFVSAAIKIILFDMADFSLIQKIIAFMIIGTMLLAASYFYQKVQLKNNLVIGNSE